MDARRIEREVLQHLGLGEARIGLAHQELTAAECEGALLRMLRRRAERAEAGRCNDHRAILTDAPRGRAGQERQCWGSTSSRGM